MNSVPQGTYNLSQYRREEVCVLDCDGVDVTPQALFVFHDDEEDELEAIFDAFQDRHQTVRTTTESQFALPDVHASPPPAPAPDPGEKDVEPEQDVEDHGDPEQDNVDEEKEEDDDIPDNASTPPPRIPTPIMEALQAIRHYKPPPEPKVTFFLKETPTFWLLTLPSKCIEWGDEVSRRLRELDGHYYWLTYDRGRLRHRQDAVTQTPLKLVKRKKTQTLAVHSNTIKLFATEWDVYDTFRQVSIADAKAIRLTRSAARSVMSATTTTGTSDAAEMIETGDGTTMVHLEDVDDVLTPQKRPLTTNADLVQCKAFRLAAAICERLLASNSYRRRQEVFIGHPRIAARQKPTEFHYHISRLFEMFNSDTEGLAVTGLAWNRKDPSILAAGYGCYLFEDDPNQGLLCCWSVKNPFQPERKYNLASGVTALSFSTERPNLLAVGLHSGHLLIVDISLYASDPRAVRTVVSERAPLTSSPLWGVLWFNYTDFVRSRESIISVGDDGWVCKWDADQDGECYPLSRIQYHPDRERTAKLELTDCAPRVLACLCATILSPESRGGYLVATKEGVVADCNMSQRSRRPSLSLAHAGPVYAIQRSPFCGNVYLTAGADWTLCLWVRGWDEALLRLPSPQHCAVEAAAWSPTHPTMIATVSGRQLQIWDIGIPSRSRSSRPMATTPNERGSRFTSLEWTSCGLSVVAGDRDGHVWVLHLSDLPHQAHMPRLALFNALSPLVTSRRRLQLRDQIFSDS